MSLELNQTATPVKFGGWLKEQRVGLGLSLREAAWRSGMSTQRLTAIETGTLEASLNHFEAQLMCKAYRITADEFIFKASSPS